MIYYYKNVYIKKKRIDICINMNNYKKEAEYTQYSH